MLKLIESEVRGCLILSPQPSRTVVPGLSKRRGNFANQDDEAQILYDLSNLEKLLRFG